jgi:acyl-CoA hydrolase
MQMLKETSSSHLIRPQDLQHHGTLFAGRLAEWLVEACFIAANRLLGKPEDLVFVQIHGISFKKPANNGDTLNIKARVALLGSTSITVHTQAFVNEDETPAVSGMMTFVTVDKEGKPYKHGLTLPQEYIAQNREIHQEARKIREQK